MLDLHGRSLTEHIRVRQLSEKEAIPNGYSHSPEKSRSPEAEAQSSANSVGPPPSAAPAPGPQEMQLSNYIRSATSNFGNVGFLYLLKYHQQSAYVSPSLAPTAAHSAANPPTTFNTRQVNLTYTMSCGAGGKKLGKCSCICRSSCRKAIPCRFYRCSA